MSAYLHVPFEIKALLAETGEFEGYGSVFGVLDHHNDIVRPGAFATSIAEHMKSGTWPAMLWSHDPDDPIGEWLEMAEDATGLKVKGKLWIDGPHPDPSALKAHRSMLTKRGKLGLSIGYRTRSERFDRDSDVRELLDVELWECSPTVFPANPAAQVLSAKSIKSERDLEALLRSNGFSHSAAQKITRGGFKALQGSRDEAGSDPARQGSRDESGGGMAAILQALRGVEFA